MGALLLFVCLLAPFVLACAARGRRRRAAANARRELGVVDDGLSAGPYKNLGSFSSVELTSPSGGSQVWDASAVQ